MIVLPLKPLMHCHSFYVHCWSCVISFGFLWPRDHSQTYIPIVIVSRAVLTKTPLCCLNFHLLKLKINFFSFLSSLSQAFYFSNENGLVFMSQKRCFYYLDTWSLSRETLVFSSYLIHIFPDVRQNHYNSGWLQTCYSAQEGLKFLLVLRYIYHHTLLTHLHQQPLLFFLILPARMSSIL